MLLTKSMIRKWVTKRTIDLLFTPLYWTTIVIFFLKYYVLRFVVMKQEEQDYDELMMTGNRLWCSANVEHRCIRDKMNPLMWKLATSAHQNSNTKIKITILLVAMVFSTLTFFCTYSGTRLDILEIIHILALIMKQNIYRER